MNRQKVNRRARTVWEWNVGSIAIVISHLICYNLVSWKHRAKAPVSQDFPFNLFVKSISRDFMLRFLNTACCLPKDPERKRHSSIGHSALVSLKDDLPKIPSKWKIFDTSLYLPLQSLRNKNSLLRLSICFDQAYLNTYRDCRFQCIFSNLIVKSFRNRFVSPYCMPQFVNLGALIKQ